MPAMTPSSGLSEEYAAITLLLALLKQEQEHLIAADIGQLTGLTAQKSLLVQQMALLAGQRHKALAAAGFGAHEAGMTAWLAAVADGASTALWNDVLGCTREAKEYNRLNGMLINKHMVRTRGALDALRPPAQGGNIYGPSGHTTGGLASRRLVLG